MVLREPQRGFWASLKQKKRKPVLNLLNASARMFGASEKRRKPVCQSYEDVEIQDNSLGRRQSDDADLLQRAFQKAEIQEPLTVLGSGLEAIRYLSGEGKYENREGFPIPFLIILDLSLPGVDGFEVLR